MKTLAGVLAALIFGLFRLTWRVVKHEDPRPQLREHGKPYILAILHGQLPAAFLTHQERRAATMISRSKDGALLMPTARMGRLKAARGSTGGQRDKGGKEALAKLAADLQAGIPIVLTIDGPKGPRGYVRRGALLLAQSAGVPIIPVAVCSSKAWVLHKSWDRMELPKPFATITWHFGKPVYVDANTDAMALRQALGATLKVLETRK